MEPQNLFLINFIASNQSTKKIFGCKIWKCYDQEVLSFLFQNLEKENKKFIPITDERMTRFFITLNEGVEFVHDCFKNTGR